MQQTPLFYAVSSDADSVVQLLLQRGATADVFDDECATPLMHARTAADVKLLLAAGANAAAVDKSQWTVLHHYATAAASVGVICLMLKAGTDPTAVDGDGSTAAHVAGIKGHFALEALLSRAADDHLKKQTVVTYSNSSSSSSDNSSPALGNIY
jgi:ankyrin repeat protein